MKIITSILENKEFLKLKNLKEKNARHDNQSVHKHTVAVMNAMENLLSSFKNQKWLKQKIGKHSREDLLIIASLLHDVAKALTFMKNADKTTKCPSHELLGSFLADDYLKNSDMNQKDLDFVKNIIFYHGFAFDAIRQCVAKPKSKKIILAKFRRITKPYSKELILMMMADSTGSDFQRMNPGEFKREMEFCRRLI